MRYMLLIYGDETHVERHVRGRAARRRMEDYEKYSNWLVEKGWMRAGDQLADTGQATTVRQTDGKVLATDGPFAETKEQLGGYYIVECANLDEALEAAGRLPAVAYGGSRRGQAASSTCERGSGGRRPPVPARVRAGGGDAHPRARRLRSGGGGRAGGVRDRARSLAAGRHPRQPGRLDHGDGPEPRDRPHPSGAAAAREDRTRRSASATSSHWVTTCRRSPTTGSA